MKPLRITRRWAGLLALLCMSVVAALAVSRDQAGSGVVAVVERAGPRAGASGGSERGRDLFDVQASSGDQVARLSNRRIDDDIEPLFPVVRKAAPARHAAEEAPAAPVAPPLPFRFLGQMIEDGKPTLFLSLNERNIVVRVGELIDDLYRVDSIENGVVAFTYLPLKQKQTLPIGERS